MPFRGARKCSLCMFSVTYCSQELWRVLFIKCVRFLDVCMTLFPKCYHAPVYSRNNDLIHVNTFIFLHTRSFLFKSARLHAHACIIYVDCARVCAWKEDPCVCSHTHSANIACFARCALLRRSWGKKNTVVAVLSLFVNWYQLTRSRS